MLLYRRQLYKKTETSRSRNEWYGITLTRDDGMGVWNGMELQNDQLLLIPTSFLSNLA